MIFVVVNPSNVRVGYERMIEVSDARGRVSGVWRENIEVKGDGTPGILKIIASYLFW